MIKFGSCHLLYFDDDTLFKGVFVVMCKALYLNYNMLTKRNYNELLVKHFRHFLNKVTNIAMEDRKINDVFFPAGMATGYVWNSAPIDGTNILQSIVTINREFCFPIDFNLFALPKLTQTNIQSAIAFFTTHRSPIR